jgi:hypothetical protein
MQVRAQAVTGQAVPGATVNAYLWPNFTSPIASPVQSDNSGRYTLSIPATYAGKTVVIIASKQTSHGVLRISTILANASANGQNGIDLNACTTLAAEELAFKGRNIPALSPGALSTIRSQVQDLLKNEYNLELTVGSPNCPLPVNFGDGLHLNGQHTWTAAEVDDIINQQMNNLPAPTGDIATAKGIVQMLRDFGANLVDIQSNEVSTIQTAVTNQQSAISSTTQNLQGFSQRLQFPLRILGFSKIQHESIIGLPAGVYQEQADSSGNTTLKLISSSASNTDWTITSSQPAGLTMTVHTQNQMNPFDLSPQAGQLTFNVVSSSDATLEYSGNISVTGWSSGTTKFPTQMQSSITLIDHDLTMPMTFNGTLNGTFTGTSSSGKPNYSQMSFSGTLNTQQGKIQVSNLTADVNPNAPPQSDLKDILVTSLTLQTQNSQQATLSLSNAEIDFQYDSVNDRNVPVSAKMTALLSASGISLNVTNMNITYQNKTLPASASGQMSYLSPTLQFNGNVSASWNQPNQSKQGTLSLVGNWTPKIGSPLTVDISLNLDKNPSATSILTINKIANGNQNLSGKITAVMGQTNPANAALALTSTPSNFHVNLSWQQGQPASGTISNGSNVKTADIGTASSLGLPDLGNAIIIKYTDGTFETAQSILPITSKL